MKTYYRVRLGEGAKHAEKCFAGNFIGADYGIAEDLTGKLPDTWQKFNAAYIPVYLANRPHKSKVAAGLACGVLWTVGRGMQEGDVVLCSDDAGRYRVGEICGPYYYAPGEPLFHRRPVKWLSPVIDRGDMSEALRKSTDSTSTVVNLSRSGRVDEILALMGGSTPTHPADEEVKLVEDVGLFAMESHLEDFLVANWPQTELGKEFDIYQEDGDQVGKQYPTDTGPLDILAISKDKKRLLVVELKKGRASDAVVGQTLRYMGFVQDQLAEEGQTVEGVIIALEDDQRIRRALSMTRNIEFFRYQISFKLVKA